MELGEVEAILDQHPDVRESIVLAREIISGDKSLVAYVVSRQEPAPPPEELRSYLRERLPDYMVPAAFVMLAELPLTPNGKVDRKALPAPSQLHAQLEANYVAPQTVMEQSVAAVWQKVFHVEQVDIHTNFFDLGGNSLLLAQVHSKLRTALNKEIQMVELFQHPTVHSLAQHLSERTDAPTLSPEPGRAEAEARLRLRKRHQPSSRRPQEKL